MAQLNPTTSLPLLRIAAGAGAYAFPDLTGKVLGLKLKDNHDAVFLGRLFGARDVLLGLGTLASTGEAKKLWWRLGIIADVADAGAGILGVRAGAPKRGHIMSTAAALGAVGLGISALGSVGK
jgi:hypothetical protein